MFNKVSNFVSLTKESRLGMYIPVPICLLTGRFSSTTLLIYGSLLNRALLSQKNDWQNDCGEVYVRFSIEELAKYACRGISTVYDRIFDMCVPLCVDGVSKRLSSAENKCEYMESVFEKGGVL